MASFVDRCLTSLFSKKKAAPRRTVLPSLPPVVTTKLPCALDEDRDVVPTPNYTTDDIVRVQRILLKFVPAELADAILDMAEYWPHVGASRNDFSTSYSALEGPDQNAQWCYMVSPPVPSVERNGRRVATTVKKVKFIVKSYESSYGKPANGPGATEPKAAIADTWFEASILKKGEIAGAAEYKEDTRPNDWFANLASRPNYMHWLRQDDCTKSEEVLNPFDSKRRWHVTNNPRVSNREWQETVWKHDDTKNTVDVDPTSGKGSGLGFLPSLSVDDRIVLMSRAQGSGLTNTIFNVKLEVYYSLASSYL